MASYTMHLAIAKEYLKNHNEKEYEKEFYKGTIDVDNVPDKNLTHYSSNIESKNVVTKMISKVNIKKYVEEHTIETSYDRGYFLHLLTDYFFYNNYFNYKDFETLTIDEFDVLLYRDYDYLNKYLINKYEVEIPENINQKYFQIFDEEPKIATYESIDEFIEFMSKLDIYDVYNKIKKSEDILYMYERKEI